MKTIYWGLLSLWLALAGCTKGVDDEPTPAGATPATDETPFYGTIETDADTRCATKDSDGQIDVHWNPTDEIALFKGCPLCSCYGVQPDQNDPSHCELYFKEGAHGDPSSAARRSNTTPTMRSIPITPTAWPATRSAAYRR